MPTDGGVLVPLQPKILASRLVALLLSQIKGEEVHWIEGFEPTHNGGHEVSVVSIDGTKQRMSMASFGKIRPSASRKRKGLATFDTRAFERGYSQIYRELSGVSGFARDGHEVFGLRQGKALYLIPAYVFLSELPGTLGCLESYLLSPSSLERMCAVVRPEVKAGMTSKPTVVIRRKFQPSRITESAKVRERLTWLRAHPTGMRFWGSVLTFAMNRRLDFSLPSALLTASFRGRKFGHLVLVDHMDIRELTPLEDSCFPEYFPDRPTFVLSSFKENNKPTFIYRAPHSRDAELAGKCEQALSNEEWWLFSHLLIPNMGSTTGKGLRQKVDFILRKLSMGLPWGADPVLSKNAAALSTYMRMHYNGRWKKFKEALLSYRAAADGGPPSDEWLGRISRPISITEWTRAMGGTYQWQRMQVDGGVVPSKRCGNTILITVPGTFYRTKIAPKSHQDGARYYILYKEHRRYLDTGGRWLSRGSIATPLLIWYDQDSALRAANVAAQARRHPVFVRAISDKAVNFKLFGDHAIPALHGIVPQTDAVLSELENDRRFAMACARGLYAANAGKSIISVNAEIRAELNQSQRFRPRSFVKGKKFAKILQLVLEGELTCDPGLTPSMLIEARSLAATL